MAFMLLYGIDDTSTLLILVEIVHPKVYVICLLSQYHLFHTDGSTKAESSGVPGTLNYRVNIREGAISHDTTSVAGNRKDNTFNPISNRYHQATILDDGIHVNTVTYTEVSEIFFSSGYRGLDGVHARKNMRIDTVHLIVPSDAGHPLGS